MKPGQWIGVVGAIAVLIALGLALSSRPEVESPPDPGPDPDRPRTLAELVESGEVPVIDLGEVDPGQGPVAPPPPPLEPGTEPDAGEPAGADPDAPPAPPPASTSPDAGQRERFEDPAIDVARLTRTEARARLPVVRRQLEQATLALRRIERRLEATADPREQAALRAEGNEIHETVQRLEQDATALEQASQREEEGPLVDGPKPPDAPPSAPPRVAEPPREQ